MGRQEGFEKILVPVDGSKFARKALLHAISVAKRQGSQVHVITVVDTKGIRASMRLGLIHKNKLMEESVTRFVEDVKTRARKEVLADVAICKSGGVGARYDILFGTAVDMILKYARGKKIDLIIIGSQGLRGFHKVTALGSVSRRVSEVSPCPVMIVH